MESQEQTTDKWYLAFQAKPPATIFNLETLVKHDKASKHLPTLAKELPKAPRHRALLQIAYKFLCRVSLKVTKTRSVASYASKPILL